MAEPGAEPASELIRVWNSELDHDACRTLNEEERRLITALAKFGCVLSITADAADERREWGDPDLRVSSVSVTPGGKAELPHIAEVLARLPANLRCYLILTKYTLDEWSDEQLALFSGVRRASVSTDQGVEQVVSRLSGFRALESLSLTNFVAVNHFPREYRVAAEPLRTWGNRWPALRELMLAGVSVTPEAIRELSLRPELQTLSVTHVDWDREQLRALSEVTQLRRLSLVLNHPVSRELRHLQRISQLQNLTLTCPVDQDQLRAVIEGVGELPSVRELTLKGGFCGGLDVFKSLPRDIERIKLRDVIIENTAVSEFSRAAIHAGVVELERSSHGGPWTVASIRYGKKFSQLALMFGFQTEAITFGGAKVSSDPYRMLHFDHWNRQEGFVRNETIQERTREVLSWVPPDGLTPQQVEIAFRVQKLSGSIHNSADGGVAATLDLSVAERGLVREALVELTKLPVTQLNIYGQDFVERGDLEPLFKIQSLRQLTLHADCVNDEMLFQVAKLPSIAAVHIESTSGAFSREGLRAFARMLPRANFIILTRSPAGGTLVIELDSAAPKRGPAPIDIKPPKDVL